MLSVMSGVLSGQALDYDWQPLTQRWCGVVQLDTIVLLANRHGVVYRSTDNGNSWSPCFRSNVNKQVLRLSADRYGRIFLAEAREYGLTGTDYDYLYMSVDSGLTWNRIFQGAVYSGYRAGTGGYVFDTRILDVVALTPSVLIGISAKEFVSRSTDGGATWEQTGLLLLSSYDWTRARFFGIAGLDSQTVCLAIEQVVTVGEIDDYKIVFAISTDSGKTFDMRVISGNESVSGGAMAVSGDRIVIGGLGSGRGVLFVSTDRGQTWEQRSLVYPGSLGNFPGYDFPMSVHSIVCQGDTIICFGTDMVAAYSTDFGRSWQYWLMLTYEDGQQLSPFPRGAEVGRAAATYDPIRQTGWVVGHTIGPQHFVYRFRKTGNVISGFLKTAYLGSYALPFTAQGVPHYLRVNSNSQWYYSNDGGFTWLSAGFQRASSSGIMVIDSATIVTIPGRNRWQITTDLGRTWQELDIAIPSSSSDGLIAYIGKGNDNTWYVAANPTQSSGTIVPTLVRSRSADGTQWESIVLRVGDNILVDADSIVEVRRLYFASAWADGRIVLLMQVGSATGAGYFATAISNDNGRTFRVQSLQPLQQFYYPRVVQAAIGLPDRIMVVAQYRPPGRPSTTYATTVFRSGDGGASWREVPNPVLLLGGFTSVAFAPDGSLGMLLNNPDTPGFFATKDFGGSWWPIIPLGPYDPAIAPYGGLPSSVTGISHSVRVDNDSTAYATTQFGLWRIVVRRIPLSHADAVRQTERLSIEIFPNPASEWARVVATSPRPVVADAWLSDLLGRNVAVLAQQQYIGPDAAEWLLSTALLPKGMYFVVVRTGDGTRAFPLVVE
jgi:hypothetical protein